VRIVIALAALINLSASHWVHASPTTQSLRVMASAYNSTAQQTDATPNEGAWGDRIEPGMKVIAVSPDLLAAGLDRGTQVRIEGLSGTWQVLDRTGSRHRRRIDIYMGDDVRKARRWGLRKVTIHWTPAPPAETSENREQ
jgi:3D (Asp-Asp-Asp) domain-containing protein